MRGSKIVEARVKLAGYLGVRMKAEAARIAAARAVVAALPEVEDEDEEKY